MEEKFRNLPFRIINLEEEEIGRLKFFKKIEDLYFGVFFIKKTFKFNKLI